MVDLRTEMVCASAYDNERHEIDRIGSALREISLESVSLAPSNAFSVQSIIATARALKQLHAVGGFWGTLRRLVETDHFVTLCQCAALLFYYARFKNELQRGRPVGVITASPTHPVAQGLSSAAKSLGLPTIYSGHAACAPGGRAPRVDASLLILDGQSSLTAMEESGPVQGIVVFKGLKGPSYPLRLAELGSRRLRIGFFLTALVDLEGLETAVRSAHERFNPTQIIIRPHPVLMLTPNLDAIGRQIPNCQIITGSPLRQCVESCDLVFAGNSNVPLDVLRLGVPTVFLPDLDRVPSDYYGFVAARIVLGTELPLTLDVQDIVNFYTPSCVERFRSYDASYLEDETLTAQRIAAAVTEVLASANMQRH